MTFNPVRAIVSRLEGKVGKPVVRQAVATFANARRTLDLGCGRSPNAASFPNRVGVDIVADRGVHIIADAHHMPFASGCFEQIVLSEVLEHLADPPTAAGEMARVLSGGGALILTTPFVYPIHEAPYDFQRFTAFGLRRLFSVAGFEVQEVRELFTEEQTLGVLLQRIAFQRRDSLLRHYLYLLLAHLLFRLPAPSGSPRFQDISRKSQGPFLTAGYLLVARKA